MTAALLHPTVKMSIVVLSSSFPVLLRPCQGDTFHFSHKHEVVNDIFQINRWKCVRSEMTGET